MRPSSRHCFQTASVAGTILRTTPGSNFSAPENFSRNPHILNPAVCAAADEGRINPGDSQFLHSHSVMRLAGPGHHRNEGTDVNDRLRFINRIAVSMDGFKGRTGASTAVPDYSGVGGKRMMMAPISVAIEAIVIRSSRLILSTASPYSSML
jgi:hypothetical protein